jgi:hypothetical protein
MPEIEELEHRISKLEMLFEDSSRGRFAYSISKK